METELGIFHVNLEKIIHSCDSFRNILDFFCFIPPIGHIICYKIDMKTTYMQRVFYYYYMISFTLLFVCCSQ